ncbi:TetR/AcrR family transcriptional regulator [Paramicrobacterium chengjingii]|uniref:TetR/AcrR family transcriptional regulator n=1 Tax=Paramicrobacterium chengjingii TaxID=2769067 RepID=A0ABX6YGH4_9MICO|nr:TetR/AcrR family transcriptional regulator [Microbacterium chengjingii]QPZ37546.1 TetR/AcrR family transcriptional regulator [Microbacterium chengjingii]
MADVAQRATRAKRADAQRNEVVLLEAAAALFVECGVDVPVRRIAEKAGVGTGTIYRHFPNRSDLVIAVYRHQVEDCAEAGPRLLGSAESPYAALVEWVDLFVDFLVTKHGLASAMRNDGKGYEGPHAYFIDRLEPVCGDLLAAAKESGEVLVDIEAYSLMLGVGNLCAYSGGDDRYEARILVGVLIAGLQVQPRLAP